MPPGINLPALLGKNVPQRRQEPRRRCEGYHGGHYWFLGCAALCLAALPGWLSALIWALTVAGLMHRISHLYEEA